MAGFPIWALEESVEDAFVAYFKANLPGEVSCYPAFSAAELKFPALVVICDTASNPTELAAFTGHRALVVRVGLMVEAVSQTDAGGVQLQDARERNRALRGAMIDAVARDNLADELNAINPPKCRFSAAQLEGAARSVGDDRVLETELTIECIANPQETE